MSYKTTPIRYRPSITAEWVDSDKINVHRYQGARLLYWVEANDTHLRRGAQLYWVRAKIYTTQYYHHITTRPKLGFLQIPLIQVKVPNHLNHNPKLQQERSYHYRQQPFYHHFQNTSDFLTFRLGWEGISDAPGSDISHWSLTDLGKWLGLGLELWG